MSEHQGCEIVALDLTLMSKEMGDLRAISTRAELPPTRLRSECQGGHLKADPGKTRKRQFRRRGFFHRWKRESEPKRW
jgi:hypothetical protein